MCNILYTAGYGNDAPEKFLARLKAAGVTVVLDVRREGSKSWCGAYRWGCGNGFGGMEQLLRVAKIRYYAWQVFGNHFSELSMYRHWLSEHIFFEVTKMSREIAQNDSEIPCLLCAEGNPFEKDGVTPRCHRVYVADALVKILGPEWSVCHI